jgi:hypothetical protein
MKCVIDASRGARPSPPAPHPYNKAASNAAPTIRDRIDGALSQPSRPVQESYQNEMHEMMGTFDAPSCRGASHAPLKNIRQFADEQACMPLRSLSAA